MAAHAKPFRLPFTLVAGAAAVSMVGAGAYAAWTSSTGGTTGTYTAATVTASEYDHDNTTFTSAVSNLLPGDFLYRYRTLENTGSVTQTFTGAVSASSTLGNTAGGLQIKVDSCATAWSGGSCAGGSTTIRTLTDTAGSPSISYGSLAAGAKTYLRYTFSLPSNISQNTFMSTSTTVTVAITGATAAGSDRTAG